MEEEITSIRLRKKTLDRFREKVFVKGFASDDTRLNQLLDDINVEKLNKIKEVVNG